MPTVTSQGILDRALEPVSRCLTRRSAVALLEASADAATQARFDELAAKANEGKLNQAEADEYDALILVADMVAILRARARALVRRQQ